MHSELNFTLFFKYLIHFNSVQRVEAYITLLFIEFTDVFKAFSVNMLK